MIELLRILTAEELREVLRCCTTIGGTPPAGEPQQIVRTLSRLCGVTNFYVFTTDDPDELLTRVAGRLGLGADAAAALAIARKPWVRERLLLAYYLEQAFQSALPERRAEFLSALSDAYSGASPLPPPPDESSQQVIWLERVLRYPSVLRAAAAAAERHRLPLPQPLASGPSAPVAPGVQRNLGGHEALYGVLLVLWRARFRLVADLSQSRARLREELAMIRQEEHHRRTVGAPPVRHTLAAPRAGLSVFLGGLTAGVMSTAIMEPRAMVLSMGLSIAGAGWALWASGREYPGDPAARAGSFLHRRLWIERELQKTEQRLSLVSGD